MTIERVLGLLIVIFLNSIKCMVFFPKIELYKLHVCSLYVLHTRAALYICMLKVYMSLENTGLNSTGEM
jgi:hypothetical protein